MAAAQRDTNVPLTAVYLGKTVIQTTEPLFLRSSWEATETQDEAVYTDFTWELNDRVVAPHRNW